LNKNPGRGKISKRGELRMGGRGSQGPIVNDVGGERMLGTRSKGIAMVEGEQRAYAHTVGSGKDKHREVVAGAGRVWNVGRRFTLRRTSKLSKGCKSTKK